MDYELYVDIDTKTRLMIAHFLLCPDCSMPLVFFDFTNGDGENTKVSRYHDYDCASRPDEEHEIQPWESQMLYEFLETYGLEMGQMKADA